MRLSTIVAGFALGVTAFTVATPPIDNSLRAPADGVEIHAGTAVDRCDRCVVAISGHCGSSPSLRCNAKVCKDLENLCKGCGVCRSSMSLSEPALEAEAPAIEHGTLSVRSPESSPGLEGHNPQGGAINSLLCNKCRSHPRFACTLSCLGCGDCKKPNDHDKRNSQYASPQGICEKCRKFRYLCRTLVCKSCRPCPLDVEVKEPINQLQDRTPQETTDPEPCSYCDISIAYCKQSEKTSGSCKNDLCPVYPFCENCPVCDITEPEGELSVIIKAQDVTTD